VPKDKHTKLADKLAKQTLKADKTRAKLNKLAQQKVAGANGSLSNTASPR
jgi:hypothetical protein